MRRTAALGALLLAACSRAPQPAPVSSLQTVARGLAAVEPCAHVIPSQWTASWPVPFLDQGKLGYRVFFYGRDGDLQKGFLSHQAEGDAAFAPDGAVTSCARRARPGPALPPAPPDGDTLAQALEKERRLYLMTEDAAALYAAGKALTPEEKARVAGYAAALGGRIESGHAPAYRALSPAFWEWVAANGGTPPAGR